MFTRIRKLGLALLTLVVLGLATAPNARADAFTFTGTLTPGSPVQLFSLTVSNASSVLIRGTANFDLALSLFDGAGDTLNVAIDEDGLGPLFVATLEDEFGNIFLMPGTYLLAVTPLPLLPGFNLSDGFFLATDQSGRELTFADFGFTGGNFTLEISGLGVTQAATVPEPTTMLLLSTGLAGVVASVRRRRARNESTGGE